MNTPHYIILLVDDSRFIRQTLRDNLEELEHCTTDIFEAGDGQEGLDVLAKKEVELVITDLEMPVMNGMEFIEKVREKPEYEDLPILLLTTVSDDNAKTKAFQLGVTDYLTKPCLEPELRARVLGYLERRRAFQNLLAEMEARTIAEEALHASFRTIKNQQEQMEEELEQARETQYILLPDTMPEIKNAKVVSKFVPMDQIGGDFYDVFELDDNQFGLMIADVTGHGISAALLSFMVSTTLRQAIQKNEGTDEIMRRTNQHLFQQMPEDKFATMFYATYDAETQLFTYTSAAHPAGLVIRAKTKEIFDLTTKGRFLGMFPNEITKYEQKSIQLMPGDKVLLYTDAISEIVNGEGTMLGVEGIKDFLSIYGKLPMEELLESLYDYGLHYGYRVSFDDDITLLGLEILS